MRIGIIGKGFVGSAVEHGFSCNSKFKAIIRVYDKNPVLSTHSLSETINHSEIIFLSVPTPANPDGSINTQIVENILFEINDCIKNDCIILLRSTLIPGSTQLFSEKFPKLNLVFNPEFLREKSANDDFINQSRVVLGGEKKLTNRIAELYNWRFQNSVPIIQTNFQTAELIKYMNNCFLATKVSFMNEMNLIASKINVDWDKAVEGSGSCFPKDLQAIIHFAESMDVDTKVLQGAWETNLKVRPSKDWEELRGRAVTEAD